MKVGSIVSIDMFIVDAYIQKPKLGKICDVNPPRPVKTTTLHRNITFGNVMNNASRFAMEQQQQRLASSFAPGCETVQTMFNV